MNLIELLQTTNLINFQISEENDTFYRSAFRMETFWSFIGCWFLVWSKRSGKMETDDLACNYCCSFLSFNLKTLKIRWYLFLDEDCTCMCVLDSVIIKHLIVKKKIKFISLSVISRSNTQLVCSKILTERTNCLEK